MSSSDLRIRVGARLQHCREIFRRSLPKPSPLAYWERRAELQGARSVVHIGHPDVEVDAVTEKQKRLLLPLFRQQLRGHEQRVLDFGCGPGRFTHDLASLVGGRAVGLDPTRRLLQLAPSNSRVSYLRSRGAAIPFQTSAFDAVWVCQVLGGIVSDCELAASADEIRRVLEPDGLLFVVENTSDKADGDYWRYRSLQLYRDLFRPLSLVHLADYDDLGERNSVLCGRLDE